MSGLAVVWANHFPGGYRLSIAALFLIAIPHYMSSFSFYFGDDNLRYYRTRRLTFFAGPALIFAAVIALRVTHHDRPVQSTMFVWNVWHVSLQSAGILAIYRRLNGGASSERHVARLAILAVGASMTFWHADRYAPLFDLLVRIHPLAPWMLPAICLPVAAGSLAVLLYRIGRRPQPLSLAEGGFLLTSLVLFHPYLWMADAQQATFAMLMGHFIQYLAIVWLLNRRKYADSHGSRHERLLGWISRRPGPLFGTLIVVGLAFFIMDRVTTALGVGMAYVILWNAMTLVHFYIDGLVWAFHTPHVRATVGPYLMPASRIVR